MHDINVKQTIIDSFLSLVPFEGINDKTLEMALEETQEMESNFPKIESEDIFPDGIYSIIDSILTQYNTNMAEKLMLTDMTSMRVRDKIALAVENMLLQFKTIPSYHEFLRILMQFYVNPKNITFGLKNTYKTVDKMWWAIGDTSIDHNFYTKRLTLSYVYNATLISFINDTSDDNSKTKFTLLKQIDNVIWFDSIKRKFFSFL